MTEARAQLNSYRQSPRKVRLLADLVRGKRVSIALGMLDLVPKRAALPIKRLIESALSNAKSLSLKEADLIVRDIRVDGGAILYRRMPRSRGMANPIRKRTSHVQVVLVEKALKVKNKKAKVSASRTDPSPGGKES